MKFLCGRPGCGQESTATLQIDAVSESVSLVDPRVSRDGVPLCTRHADATTPPMGWAMNDLRSTSKVLGDADQAMVEATPPRVRPPSEPLPGRTMSSRQSIAERARQRDGLVELESSVEVTAVEVSAVEVTAVEVTAVESIAVESAVVETESAPPPRHRDKPAAAAAPSSRPARRREVAAEAEEQAQQEMFPWHYRFEDDEPEELHASSPLLSRAFRSTIGH